MASLLLVLLDKNIQNELLQNLLNFKYTLKIFTLKF